MAGARGLGAHRWRFVEAGLWGIALERLAGAAPEPRRAPLANGAVIRPAGQADALPLSLVMALPELLVARRLVRGNRCYLAEIAGRIAGYGWVSTGREEIPEFERAVNPAPDEAYIWDCLTVPAYRGRGLMPAILGQITADLARRGLRRAWAVILADNYSSQRAFRRAGFIPVLAVSYQRQPDLRDLALSGDPTAPPDLIAAAKRLFEGAEVNEVPHRGEREGRL